MDSGTATVRYSDVQGGWSGDGNIDADPFFFGGPAGVWTANGVYDPLTYLITFTDAAAAWDEDALVDMTVNPDTAGALQFVITANTATTITVWANWEANASGASWVTSGMSYQVHDFHLTAASPCSNGGNNDAPSLPDEDFDGEARIQQCRVDMGPDESPWFIDCNDNGISDACDLAECNGSPWCGDCNDNGVIDQCEPEHSDIGLFVGQLLAESQDPVLVCMFDQNGDATLDGTDIQGFVDRRLNS